MGDVGDFYFRTSTSDFYGPKTASSWGTPTNLKGATGATGSAGAAGSKIFGGTAIPATDLGSNGDFYFRTTTADFYGPKTSSGWGKPINLKGIKGDAGSRIYSGAAIPANSLGNVGDFYFRTSTSDFYGPKTASGWGTPTTLKGSSGAPGAAGSKIWSGTAVPTASIGINGDFYLRTTTADFYGPKTSSGWGKPINLKGLQGPAGPHGPPGTANVVYSDWIRANWTKFGAKLWTFSLNGVTALANSSQASVLMYMRLGTATTNYPLPHHVPYGSDYERFSYRFSNSNINVRLDGIGMDISPLAYNEVYLRYVIIPGGISATATSNNRITGQSVEIKGTLYSKSELKNMSYTEISKLVGIPD